MNRTAVLALMCLIITATGCLAQTKQELLKGYDLTKPERIDLPKQIDQISGITYHEQDNTVYAIDDDHGGIYQVTLQVNPKVSYWSFGKKKDYEDIVLTGNQFYVLNSKGSIIRFPASFPLTEGGLVELAKPDGAEFETLYADGNSRLIMLCKHCADDKKSEVSAYAYDLATNHFDEKPALVLKTKSIEEKLGKEIGRFKPSAASVNPRTGEVFIVSSVNKLLVVTDKNLEVKGAYPLDPALFKQPEGICFNTAGDMLISNEAAGQGQANILIFKRH